MNIDLGLVLPIVSMLVTAVAVFIIQKDANQKRIEKETADMLFAQVNLMKTTIQDLQEHVDKCENERKIYVEENSRLMRVQSRMLQHLPESIWKAMESIGGEK